MPGARLVASIEERKECSCLGRAGSIDIVSLASALERKLREQTIDSTQFYPELRLLYRHKILDGGVSLSAVDLDGRVRPDKSLEQAHNFYLQIKRRRESPYFGALNGIIQGFLPG